MKMIRWIHFLSAERRQEVLDELEQASSPGFDYFLLVVLSCSIATFGLITDSTAVIIGAMLVAPLMSPILGLSLASISGEKLMFQRAGIALIEGVFLAILLSFSLGWIAHALPFGVLVELPGEVLARISPTPFDLGIALAGGAAAAYALAQPRLSAALPGVAIATALMPPVCTVGLGLSLGNLSVALGAGLLFLTNLTAISFAGIIVFVALGFHPVHIENTWHHIPRSLFVSAILVLFTAVPLVILTIRLVDQAHALQEVQAAVTAELSTLPDAQLVEVNVERSNSTLHLRVTVRTSRQPDYLQVSDLQKAIATRLQRTIALQLIIVPTTKLDPLVPPTRTPTFTPVPTHLPGPSFTPTSTSTSSPTLTATLTQTCTPTPSSSPTATGTSTTTFTPTPVSGFVANTNRKGIYLRSSPGGKIVGALSEGAPVLILDYDQDANGMRWIKIRDMLNRSGWIQAMYLVIRP